MDPAHGSIDSGAVQRALSAADLGPLSLQSVVARPGDRFLAVATGRLPACDGPFVDIGAHRWLGGEK